MFALLALLASQPVDPATAKNDLDAVVNRTSALADQTFECMDREVKSQAKAHIIDGTPQNIVETALASCSYLKKQYAEAAMDPHGVISATAAQSLADDWFEKVKGIYLKQVDSVMTKPDYADARFNVVSANWRKCVTDNATAWSRLSDEAATVGKAAVTACNSFRPGLISSIGFVYRSKGLSAADASDLADKLEGKMQDVATAVIISERAKRLPKGN